MQGEESDAKSDRGYTEEWTSSVTRNMRGMWYKPLSYRTSRTGDARLLGAQAPPRRGGGGVGDACVAPVRGSINSRFFLEQKRVYHLTSDRLERIITFMSFTRFLGGYVPERDLEITGSRQRVSGSMLSPLSSLLNL